MLCNELNIFSYEFVVVSSSSPMAKIEPARSIIGKEILAPKVASFSSRGPSPDYADIIKVPRVQCNARHSALVNHGLPSHSALVSSTA